jgi:predicted transcriptional regulator
VLTDALAQKLAALSEVTDRIPQALPASAVEEFAA